MTAKADAKKPAEAAKKPAEAAKKPAEAAKTPSKPAQPAAKADAPKTPKAAEQAAAPKTPKGEAGAAPKTPKGAAEGSASGNSVPEILKKVLASPNRPKKQDKFVNYVKNTFKITDDAVVEQVWNSYKKSQNL